LAHLHQHDLVHRDIKPSNVIFVNGVPKLGDIGLVAEAGDTQSIVGTEGYLPSEGPGTPQADIFSLGKVLYEISTGMDRRRFPELPEDLRDWPDRKQVVEFNEILLKACAKDSAQRYQTAEALRKDLDLLDSGKSVRGKRRLDRASKVAKQWAFSFIALGIFTVGVLSLVNMRGRFRHPGEASSASSELPPSTNEQATKLCYKAMNIVAADNSAELPLAYTNFLKAIALDTNYVQPLVGLFKLRTQNRMPGLPPLNLEEFRAIVLKLQQLAPNLAATLEAQSRMSYFELDFPQAERQILKALDADPKANRAFYAYLLTMWGRAEKAREQLRITLTNTPADAIVFRIMGHTYYLERDFTNAIAWYTNALDLDPRHAPAYQFMGRAYMAQGDYTNGMDMREKADILYGGDPIETRERYDELRWAYTQGGTNGYWEKLWQRTEKGPKPNYYWKAEIKIHLGETNEALGLLSKEFEFRTGDSIEAPLSHLLFDECWDGLHDNPEFKQLLDKIGFTNVMRPASRAHK
jgi:tetratricopeptide (TPR) repeat protein